MAAGLIPAFSEYRLALALSDLGPHRCGDFPDGDPLHAEMARLVAARQSAGGAGDGEMEAADGEERAPAPGIGGGGEELYGGGAGEPAVVGDGGVEGQKETGVCQAGEGLADGGGGEDGFRGKPGPGGEEPGFGDAIGSRDQLDFLR